MRTAMMNGNGRKTIAVGRVDGTVKFTSEFNTTKATLSEGVLDVSKCPERCHGCSNMPQDRRPLGCDGCGGNIRIADNDD